MEDVKKKCVAACGGNIFDKVKYTVFKKVDGWDVRSNNDNSFYLIKDFKFENFEESQKFVNKVTS